ncbi:T9SS type A sorting domain-containing protein [Hymenobacter sp. YC55]|uniref:T9SS type A sorting domain-containing protein n=1 Tax=Hymenobacter sp. YC55 TaxID=3034019 RepID=UPI0023F6FCFC|nr:T9SS type A sorting domain-containing protein [Hymenobacter sp. YC55]MDF7810338.1 T9SS type A sorting domain-containing protein [Hymenobacter sp. YC55]
MTRELQPQETLKPNGAGDENWQSGFGEPGIDATVNALVAAPDGNVYAGGAFNSAGGVSANRIARWDGLAWSALGQGINGVVYALAVAPNGDLYVGGNFPEGVAGVPGTQNLARWNGTAWSAVGGGVDASVLALTVAPNGDLYAGGSFATAGGVAAARIARWNGITWSALGSGTNADVTALTSAATGDVYAGGIFRVIDGQPVATGVARWNGTTWTPLESTGTYFGSVTSLVVGPDGKLYAGGFIILGSSHSVVRWDGTSWSELGGGLALGGATSLAFGPNGVLYAAGDFGRALSGTARGFAQWNGTFWSNLGGGLTFNNFGTPKAITVGPSGTVYAGGSFTSFESGLVTNRVAQLNDGIWAPMGKGLNAYVQALAVAANGDVYAGGLFYLNSVSVPNTFHIGLLTSTGWQKLGDPSPTAGFNSFVYALGFAPDGTLYAGGIFSSVNNRSTGGGIARQTNSGWQGLGSTLGGDVYAIAFAPNGDLYVGGAFTIGGGKTLNNVARWDGTTWQPLGNGIVGRRVLALAFTPNGDLYAGGDFDTGSGAVANGVARWDGTAWSRLGNIGTNNIVWALAAAPNGDLYVGGEFNTVDGPNGLTANKIARWDGSAWSALGNGLGGGGPVSALAVAPDGQLYVGGSFTGVLNGPPRTANIARWDGTNWYSLGTGLNGRVLALASGRYHDLFAGGDFTGVGDGSKRSARIGRYFTNGAPTNLTVSSTQVIPAGNYNNITITGPDTGGPGKATLGGNVTVNGNMLVQAGGTLDDGCSTINGPGTFRLAAGATLRVCSPQGIEANALSGAIQVAGTRFFSSDASYEFGGTTPQVVGSGLPFTMRNLVVSNATGVSLVQPISIRQALTLAGSGNLNLNNWGLTLLSDITGTALVVNQGTGLVVGTATVQRYITPAINPGLGYRHYSAPVRNTTVSDLATFRFVPEVNAAYNTSVDPGTVSPFPTVFGYDETRIVTSPAVGYTPFDRGWVSPESLTDSLEQGRGYSVNIPATETVSFVGTLGNGSVTKSNLTRSGTEGGWHLLGNPYPAPLDWSTVEAPNRPGLDGAVYVLESTGQYAGQYRAYTNGIGNPLVASSQGFFVHTSTADVPGSLTLTNANRITSFATQAILQRPAVDGRPQLELQLQGETAAQDATTVYLQDGATAGFDSTYDAAKLRNPSGLSLYSLTTAGTPASELAINGLPTLTSTTVVPLGVALPQPGAYSLTASRLANFGGNRVYLLDAVTGQQLLLTPQMRYPFTATSTNLAGRFSLRLEPTQPMATLTTLAVMQVGLYPNPARNTVTLTLPASHAARVVEIVIYNTLGQQVRQTRLMLSAVSAQGLVDITGLRAGVYSVRVQTGTGVATKCLVVE